MNALFLDADGTIFDYHDGLKDLRQGKVRFVGDPATRIREDVLRLLRFYRFHAWYGRGAADPAARAACRQSTPLLATLSGERVHAELLKLLKAPDPAKTLALMEEDGVLGKILPATRPLEVLARLVKLEASAKRAPDPLLRLAVVIAGDVERIAAKLKLSNAERERLESAMVPLDLEGLRRPRHVRNLRRRRRRRTA